MGSIRATTPAGSSGPKLIFAWGENPRVISGTRPALQAVRVKSGANAMWGTKHAPPRFS